MKQTGHSLHIPADVEELGAVRRFVREQAFQAGADRRATDDLVQAVDESVTNTIEHGYQGAGGTVEVEFDRAEGAIIVRLRDQAPAFDPTTVPNPDTSLPLERRPYRGMGVFLTRELTDSVTYRHTDEGNELTLVKRIRKPEGG